MRKKLVCLLLAYFVCLSINQNTTQNSTFISTQLATTETPESSYYTTTENKYDKVKCNSTNSYVYIEEPSNLQGIILSEMVDYGPLIYFPLELKEIFILPSDIDPCNISLIHNISMNIYNNIVLIMYSNKYVCNPQQWTLNMEIYDAAAVLIVNNVDENNVYILLGDNNLNQPVITTRMISQLSGENIINITSIKILISIKCFINKYPDIICIRDQTENGKYYIYDGEYQKQLILINGYPLWIKQGIQNIFNEYYIYLYNKSLWIISNDIDLNYNHIIAYCNYSIIIYSPSLCNNNWYLYDNSSLINLHSSDKQCDLSDNYLCILSDSNLLSSYIGSYQQLHNNVLLWILHTREAIININVLSLNSGLKYTQTIIDIIDNKLIAFCSFQDYSVDNVLNISLAIKPWICNEWFIFNYNTSNADIDDTFNIDYTKCNLNYDINICLISEYNQYNQYQYLFGLYILDKMNIYNGHYSYINQRINDIYLLWNETYSSWIIKSNAFNSILAICNDKYVELPINCNCWLFINNDNNDNNNNCNNFTISNLNCSQNNNNNNNSYIPKEICVHFTDIEHDIFNFQANGEYTKMINNNITSKPFWQFVNTETNDIYSIIYNDYYRFWIFNNISTNINNFDFWCLQFNEFNPINCEKWYYSINSFIKIDMEDCTIFNQTIYNDNDNDNNNNDNDNNIELIVIIVLPISIILIIIIALIIIYKYYAKQHNGNDSNDSNDSYDTNGNDNIKRTRNSSIMNKIRSSIVNNNKNDNDDDNDDSINNHFNEPITGYIPRSSLQNSPIQQDNNDNTTIWENFEENEIGNMNPMNEIELVDPINDGNMIPSILNNTNDTINNQNNDQAPKKRNKKRKKRSINIPVHHDDDDDVLDL